MVALQAHHPGAEDLQRVERRQLTDIHPLEPALQGRVAAHPAHVLVFGRRPDHAKIAAHQRRLEHVAGVHGRAHRRPLADQVVQLVDEQDDVASGRHTVDQTRDPRFVLPTVRGSAQERDVIEGENAHIPERQRNGTRDDPLRESFDDRGLAHTGAADERGIVLAVAQQNVDDARDLRIPAADGIEPPIPRLVRQVTGISVQIGVMRPQAQTPL